MDPLKFLNKIELLVKQNTKSFPIIKMFFSVSQTELHVRACYSKRGSRLVKYIVESYFKSF